MSYPVLARRDTALDDAETTALLRDRIGGGIVGEVAEYGELTVEVAPADWHRTIALCRDEDLLSFDLFDCLFGVDAGEEGLDVVAVLYSTSKGRRLLLRTRCEGGREAPVVASVADVYAGANWHEREAFDMFGIDFEGHPGLLPRILCIENFEGWPLRKEFPLASRVAKPWPGVKDPAEPDEDGNVIVREPAIGEAPGPSGLDEIIARQAREANPTSTPEVDADQGASGGADAANAASEEPQREEVELDQEVYDRLIGEGKSERIARSKAKAAFIKKQRAAAKAAEDEPAEQEREEQEGGEEPDVAATSTDEAEAPPSPDAEAGAGTEGATAAEAAPKPSIPDVDDESVAADDVDSVDEPAPAEASDDQQATVDEDVPHEPDVDDEAAASASARADAARADQAAAREAKANEASDDADDADEGLTPVPAGSPPPDPDDDEVAPAADATDGETEPIDADSTDEGAEPATDEIAEAAPEAIDEAAGSTDDATAVDDTDGAVNAADATDATDEAEDPDDEANDAAATTAESVEPVTDDTDEAPEASDEAAASPDDATAIDDPDGAGDEEDAADQADDVDDAPTGEPVTDDAPTAEPATDDAETDEPVTDGAATAEPATDDAETDEPVTDDAATDVPVTDDAATGEPVTDDAETDEPVTDDAATDEGAADNEPDDPVADGPEVDEPGPFGPGSAYPREDGSGPHGWRIKATQDGNVFHTEDSPNWRTAQADVWFDDVAAARAAGFAHWDPYVRTDLEADPVTSTTHDGPAPVGGTLPTDDGVEIPGRTADVDLHVDDAGEDGPPGYGALDVHQREPAVEPHGEGEDGDGPYGAGSAAPAEDGSGPDGWTVKGNADSMLFHTDDSPQFDDTKAEVWFASIEAARAAGFRHWDRSQRRDQSEQQSEQEGPQGE